jgi:ribulose 1,5-bisphosphate synthetase/thiazole synthase
MKTIAEPAREIPVIRDVDVCVVGGGPGGLPAAWQAAKHGAKTLLIESFGFLGGMATAGYVGPMLGLKEVGSDRPTAAGTIREFADLMHEMGEGRPWEEHVKSGCIPFDAETMKLAADRMCAATGVELLLHANYAASVVEGNALQAIVIESKSGRQAITARCFVDATGDADVAFRAGAECTKGRPADGLMMAMGSSFLVGGVDRMKPEQREEAVRLVNEARDADEFRVYGVGFGGHGSVLRPGYGCCNMTRFMGDATDVEDLTTGEIYTREQIARIVRFWRERVPGMEEAHLVATPPMIGIRETRQLVGEKRVTGADVVAGKKLADAVARCSYWIDIHCPRGLANSQGLHLCRQSCPNSDCTMLTDHLDELPEELYPPDYFDIPYGALVPEQLDNLLVSGRCCSLDYQAMAAARVMIPVMAIGEACGVAAALAADGGVTPRRVDVQSLRGKLQTAGCIC